MTNESGSVAPAADKGLATQLVREGLISLREAAPIFGTGRGGKSRHPATLTRDILKGATLPSGRRVRLEALRINGAFKTSRLAVLRYIEAQNAIDDPADTSTAPPVTPAARRSAQVAASAELDAVLGISN